MADISRENFKSPVHGLKHIGYVVQNLEEINRSREILPLIIYFVFVKYLRKNGNTMRQCISSL
jgi:hypothetical protein